MNQKTKKPGLKAAAFQELHQDKTGACYYTTKKHALIPVADSGWKGNPTPGKDYDDCTT